MNRRDFIKKATLAAAGVAVASTPISAMINEMTNAKQPRVLLINGSPRTDGNTFCCLKNIHAGGNTAPQRDERQAFMNFIR